MENQQQAEEQTKMAQAQATVKSWSQIVWDNIWKIIIVLVIIAVAYYLWTKRGAMAAAGTPAVSEAGPIEKTFRVNKIRI